MANCGVAILAGEPGKEKLAEMRGYDDEWQPAAHAGQELSGRGVLLTGQRVAHGNGNQHATA